MIGSRKRSIFGFDADHALSTAAAFNGKMSELHAAVGLAVLDGYDAILAERRRVASLIREAARPGVRWQEECERSTWQFVPARLEDAATRQRTAAACAATLETRVYYEPLHGMARLARPLRPFLLARHDRASGGRGPGATDGQRPHS